MLSSPLLIKKEGGRFDPLSLGHFSSKAIRRLSQPPIAVLLRLFLSSPGRAQEIIVR
jgi:hypothetical protein